MISSCKGTNFFLASLFTRGFLCNVGRMACLFSIGGGLFPKICRITYCRIGNLGELARKPYFCNVPNMEKGFSSDS